MSELEHQRSADTESLYSKQNVLWLGFSSLFFFGYLSFATHFETCLGFAKYELVQLPLQSL